MRKDDAWQRWQGLVGKLDQRQRVGLIGKLVTSPVESADEIDPATLDDEELLDRAERWSATHLSATLRSIVASAASPADLRGSLDHERARSERLPLGVAAALLGLDGELPQVVVDGERHRRFGDAVVVDLPRVSIEFDDGRRALRAQPVSVVTFLDGSPEPAARFLPHSFMRVAPDNRRALHGVLLAERGTGNAGAEFIAAGVRVVSSPSVTPGHTRGIRPEPLGNVAWVTDAVDAEVRRSRRMVLGEEVELRTEIGGAFDEGALAAHHIPLAALTQGAVRFKVVCDGAQVRAKAPATRFGPTLTSEPIVSDGVEPIAFSFVLRADEPGPVAIDVFLLLRDRTALLQSIELTAEAASAQPAAAGLDVPVAFSALDATHLMTLPAPTACIRIDRREPLTLDVTLASRDFPVEPATGLGELAGQAIRWRTRLIELSERYAPDHDLGLADGGAALLGFATIGAEIHRALFGHPDEAGHADLKDTARSLCNLGAQSRPLLHIIAQHLPLPWGVIYDGVYAGQPPPQTAAEVDPRRFWGHRFLIERIARASLNNVPAPALRKKSDQEAALVPCINRHVDAMQGVEAARHQLAFFDALAAGGAPLRCAPRIEQRAELEQLLRGDRGAARLLYFFCHGNAAATVNDRFFLSRAAPDVEAWLSLDAHEAAAERIDVAWLRGVRPSPLAGQPLVFLNACSTAQGDREFQSQFLTQFMQRWNVRGLIGTDWKIPTIFADRFSRRLLDRFVRGRVALGPAFAATSDEFLAAGNPFPLIYAMYARPDMTVEAS